MTRSGNIRVAIVGLGFGAEFIPIYQAHPNAEMYAICRRNLKALDECGDKFDVEVRYTNFSELINDPNVDAVCTSARRFRTTRRRVSPRSRPANMWPAPFQQLRPSTSAGRSSRHSARAARST